MGFLYSQGQGVGQDFVQAAKWYRMAAEQGDVDSQNRLAGLYLAGDGVQQDYAEAARWYRKAADQGDTDAQNELGSLYGNGHGVEKDYVEAYRWFELTATRNPGNDFETRENAARNRDMLAARMTPAEIAEAQKRAKAWKPQ